MKKAIATVTSTKSIMDKYGLKTKKHFGQNFIVEPKIVEKIADLSGIDSETAVIEIGPGLGALTEQLAKRSGKVYAYEIDASLIKSLRDNLSDYTNIEIIQQDFLTVDLKTLAAQIHQQYSRIVVTANLPYYITTPLLFHIFESQTDISQITVMMQQEVANRFAAIPKTKDYNALSVIVQYLYEAAIVMKISKDIFIPKPKVDSAVLRLTPKPQRIAITDQQQFFNMVKACFKQRRKTLYNNLKEILDPEIVVKGLKQIDIDPQVRAEALTLQQYLDMYEVFYEKEIVCEN